MSVTQVQSTCFMGYEISIDVHVHIAVRQGRKKLFESGRREKHFELLMLDDKCQAWLAARMLSSFGG